nr:MAG TPA: hypothetical protein [Caudoviricetes sp.]
MAKWNFRENSTQEKVPLDKNRIRQNGTLELCGTLESSGLNLRAIRGYGIWNFGTLFV